MKKISISLALVACAILLPSLQYPPQWNDQSNVMDLLHELGQPLPPHFITPTPQQIKQGEEIAKLGRTTAPDGKQSKYVSKYYVCTTCHNLQREDPDLRISDPETRLPYVKSKGIPFLQGTTFRGIVNRETWYNDDYVKKYGPEKVGKAHNSLRESIQLCAIECSQGRPMERWEVDAVLAYYWTLQWKLGDLSLKPEGYQKINAVSVDEAKRAELIQYIKSLYLQKSPAHFYDSAPNKRKGYEGLTGNADRGRDIYELSCLHCHHPEGVSHYILDETRLSYRNLKRLIPKNSHMSLYQIIPYGTYAIPGHRPYMPHYPLERMDKQQVEDLRAFIEQEAR